MYKIMRVINWYKENLHLFLRKNMELLIANYTRARVCVCVWYVHTHIYIYIHKKYINAYMHLQY